MTLIRGNAVLEKAVYEFIKTWHNVIALLENEG
jgi:hypothetical protein